MKKIRLICLLFFIFNSLSIMSQDYSSLWEKVDKADKSDHIRTKIELLDEIILTAEKKQHYGQLLKAIAERLRSRKDLSRDSVMSDVIHLVDEAKRIESQNKVLSSVYYYLAGSCIKEMYLPTKIIDEKQCFEKAMAYPEALAEVTTKGFVPFVQEHKDSRIFNDDLLHIMASDLKRYDIMREVYQKKGNRKAVLLATLWDMEQKNESVSNQDKLAFIDSLKNLKAQYADLDVSIEVEKVLYKQMSDVYSDRPKLLNDFLQDARKRWEKDAYGSFFTDAYNDLIHPQYYLEMPSRWLPQRSICVNLNDIRNVGTLTFKVYAFPGITRERMEAYEGFVLDEEDDKIKSLLRKAQLLKTHTVTYRNDSVEVYDKYDDVVYLNPLKVGYYIVEIVSSQKQIGTVYQSVVISNVGMLNVELPEGDLRQIVVNATTGEPLPQATIVLLKDYDWFNGRYVERKDNRIIKLTTDDKGENILHNTFDKDKQYEGYATYQDDIYMDQSSFSSKFTFYKSDRVWEDVKLYTDRKVYRPGQQVQVSLIAFTAYPDNRREVLAGKNITLTLFDANNQEVQKIDVVTDKMGVASANFTLPTGKLTGYYYIRESVRSYAVNFTVDEYKLPTFDVNIEKPQTSYREGDTLHLKGVAKRYTGVPIAAGYVEYTVVRRSAGWYYWGNSEPKEIWEGSIKTNEQGEFDLKFPLTLPTQTSKWQSPFYQFDVEAVVTDAAGESHEGTLVVPLGLKPSVLITDLSDRIPADSLRQFTIERMNAAGKALDGEIRYRFVSEKEKNPSVVAWQTASANKPIHFDGTSLSSGKYTLEAICENDTLKHSVIVFRLTDNRPATETNDWFYQSAREFPGDGSPVYIQVGNSKPQQHIFYTLTAGGKLLESGTILQNNDLYTRSFTYDDRYGDDLFATFAWFADGQAYTHQVRIVRPLPDKRLIVKWETFRDKLLPGQKETWKVHISRPNGEPVSGRLMATLYNKALDQLRKHQWLFEDYFETPQTSMWWNSLGEVSSQYYNVDGEYITLPVKSRSYSYFKLMMQDAKVFDFVAMPHGRNYATTRYDVKEAAVAPSSMKFTAPVVKRDSEAKMETSNRMLSKQDATVNDEEKDDVMPSGNAERALRTSFETNAFFFPSIQSDEKGNAVLSFTLPESVTTWRFLGLAHDKELNYGLLEGQVIARKSVMIQPNMPRFVRMGDHIQLSATVSNLSDNAIKGTAILKIKNAEDDRVVWLKQVKVNLSANSQEVVTFPVTIEDKQGKHSFTPGMYTCAMYIEGGSFTDGEQHYLSVMPEEMWVTSTLPIVTHQSGKQQYDLKALGASKLKLPRLTLEYTNNPQWLMLLSLPALSQPQYENAISLAASYYANKMSLDVLRINPELEIMYAQWKLEKGNENTLLSELERNQELKTMALSETPWVTDAKNETENRQALAKYYDVEKLKQGTTTLLAKLANLQNSNGSWSWYRGMRGSLYVTLSVAEMLTKLNDNAIVDRNLVEQHRILIRKALNSLHPLAKQEADWLKAEHKKGNEHLVPEWILRYLYILVLSHENLTEEQAQTQKYLLSHFEKYNNEYTIYGKALAARTLAYYQRYDKARELVESIRQYTVYSPLMGRYYDTQKAYYSWFDYRIPTQTAAIEALMAIPNSDKKTIDEMRQWLLMCKQSQLWDTPINSVEAIHVFFEGKDQPLPMDKKSMPKIALDGKNIDTESATAGIGYIKNTYQDKQAMADRLVIDKPTNQTSWGAVYLQGLQAIKEVSESGNGLKVVREIVGAENAKVGDIVKVRITITADRDYDFVQIEDQRAACMEPKNSLSGYQEGYYYVPGNNVTRYFFERLRKGTLTIETPYYIDRSGDYHTGICTVQCAYSPAYYGRTTAVELHIPTTK